MDNIVTDEFGNEINIIEAIEQAEKEIDEKHLCACENCKERMKKCPQ